MSRKNPALYQINTRAFLSEISRKISRIATLDDIPDSDLEQWAKFGFDWIYMLSVWQTGEAGRRISQENPVWRKEYEETLPDLQEEDIAGSGFAITGYTVSDRIGGEEALLRFRKRLASHDMKLMLDFVPNHTAPDHPWTDSHPGFFIHGTEEDLKRTPDHYTRIKRKHDKRILAYGRDPYYPGWPDTLQLNYGNPHLQKAMSDELANIASKCDGVRCDMAMLLLPDVFQKTWKMEAEPFWPEAIRLVKEQYPDFILMGEVYWDMEWVMQQQGFDYTYDKRLYDRLLERESGPVREHLVANLNYQEKLARFLENHDEQRIASILTWETHQAASIITFLTPGLKFFHRGEMQGWKKKITAHLGRGPEEISDPRISGFYLKLLEIVNCPEIHVGEWNLLTCHPAWDGNQTHENFIAFSWKYLESFILVVVNYADCQGQCLVKVPFSELKDLTWRFHDILSDSTYEHDDNDLVNRGLFLDMAAWGYHVFDVRRET
ncbi:MAG: alpha-amylase [Bacteroidetes bacterium]|nr:alpha-amylase [Bacteroidota bacterium]